MKYIVVSELFNVRSSSVNKSICLKKGQEVPTEVLAKYTAQQLEAHVKSGKIEIQDGNGDRMELQNKIMPQGNLKSGSTTSNETEDNFDSDTQNNSGFQGNEEGATNEN